MPSQARSDRVRILLADDHVIFRDGLKLLLGLEPGWQIVGEQSSLDGLHARVAELTPDLLLLDYHMPGGDTAASVAWLRQRHPELKIAMLTGAQSPTVFKQLLDLGVHALLLKQGSGAELVEALRRVLRGDVVVDAALRQQAEAADPGLTPRELQVTKMIAEGLSNAQMAELLHLAPKTVDKHRENLMRKLQVSSAAQLVARVRDLGLFS
ncbi:DNA-binding NarL/FixJ family response regulator [Inhella inkyongensis]|uniref:DNA-binding NarL/FixJ family response regulator n=1 Tax=Inhella inkyongensis TaxID=392593 RepID=A0A840S1D1_9BURK|nr:response regulator transcription factor [Inhella inkyongensis]MBB5204937.1 DNA-binding NarL/FixJ family response regulator [Inhella inkyongensis]